MRCFCVSSAFPMVISNVVLLYVRTLQHVLSFAALLQVGRHANVLQALSVARRTDGAKGLFRGTVPLLSREVPFYVVGMTGYAYLKKVFDGELLKASGPATAQCGHVTAPYAPTRQLLCSVTSPHRRSRLVCRAMATFDCQWLCQ